MRITLADKIDPDIACRLADLLEIPFISLSESLSTSNGIPSDDEDIDLICSKIMGNSDADIAAKGFFLNNYPHNVIQAKSLDMALARIGQPVSAALILESSKTSQNRIKSALIRYYRSQNKLILIDKSLDAEDICQLIHSIHDKRRTKKPA